MVYKGSFDIGDGRLAWFVKEHFYLTVLLIAAVHFIVVRLTKATPPKRLNSNPLKISEIYVYPIKSLRPTRISAALATKDGFQYDRSFMLLEVTPDGSYKNMAVARVTEMTQFLTSITLPKGNASAKGFITVTFKGKTLEIPLKPDSSKLETLEVMMHDSPTKAFKMPAEFNTWFSSCFGFDVVLAYIGDNRRTVLFKDLNSPGPSSWLSKIPFVSSLAPKAHQITFTDCAAYLVVSRASLDNVSSRLPDGEEMEVTKFRPNIVIEGAKEAWEEDYWGSIHINETELTMAHNCVRCASINIDYNTGKPGTGESGQVLKKLQKDRRVDEGAKWSPVFGRYTYWNPGQHARVFQVGDEVVVTKINKERTIWTWSGLG